MRILALLAFVPLAACGEPLPVSNPTAVERDMIALVPDKTFCVVYTPKMGPLVANLDAFFEIHLDREIGRHANPERPGLIAWSAGSLLDPIGQWSLIFHARDREALRTDAERSERHVATRGDFSAISPEPIRRQGGRHVQDLLRGLPPGDAALRLDLDRAGPRLLASIVAIHALGNRDRGSLVDAFAQLAQDHREFFTSLDDLADTWHLLDAGIRVDPDRLEIDWRLVGRERALEELPGDLAGLVARLPDRDIQLAFRTEPGPLLFGVGLMRLLSLSPDPDVSELSKKVLSALETMSSLAGQMRGANASAWEIDEDGFLDGTWLMEVNDGRTFVEELANTHTDLLGVLGDPGFRFQLLEPDLSLETGRATFRGTLAWPIFSDSGDKSVTTPTQDQARLPIQYFGQDGWVASAIGSSVKDLEALRATWHVPAGAPSPTLQALLKKAGKEPLLIGRFRLPEPLDTRPEHGNPRLELYAARSRFDVRGGVLFERFR